MTSRFVRFNVVSALGVGVQVGTLWSAIHARGLGYLPATLLGVTAAVVHNFVWHCGWTWRDRAVGSADRPAAFVRFALGNGLVSLVGNLALMPVLVTGIGLPAVAANLTAVCITGLLNYELGDRIVRWNERARLEEP